MPATALPRVYTIGFRAGQTIQHFWSTLLVYAVGSDHPESFAVSNKLWARLQEAWPEVLKTVTTFPVWYRHWWMDLLRNDPVHLFVETTLLLSVLYMIVTRTKDYAETGKDKLTKAEEDDLIYEWKTKLRAPLAVPLTEGTNSGDGSKDVPEFVVHKVEGTRMEVTMDTDPTHYSVVNFGTFDFLGFSAEFTSTNATNNNPVKQASKDALERYGCGACGPRGFYGTIDPHLKLEAEFTKFMGTDGAILYSDGASTVSSTIAAFCKRGDLVVVDEGVQEPIIAGVKLSRAYVKWFKHNDMVCLGSFFCYYFCSHVTHHPVCSS